MSLPVFVHDGVAVLTAGSTAVLDGDEGRHAATVKRLRVGEQVLLVDGAGHRARAVITATAKASLELEIAETGVDDQVWPRVTVVQAIPKGERADLAVEVLTEIDVDVIVPWAAARSVAVWRGERAEKSLARWRSTARAAAKQARRSRFPEVTAMAGTAEVVKLIEEADLAVVLHEEGGVALDDLGMDGVRTLVVVVGPEGGISEEELEAFAAGAVVKIGTSVLRTSTAGVAAVAALLSRTDRWR